MPSLGNDALTTVANLQEKLRIASVETDRLTNIINRVTDRIEHFTERKLLARNYDGSTAHGGTSIAAEQPLFYNWEDLIHYDEGHSSGHAGHFHAAYDSYRLHLRQYPLQKGGNNDITFSIQTLASRDNAGGEVYNTALLENDDYIIEEQEDGVIAFITYPSLNIGLSGNGIRQIKIQGTFGFNSVPDQLEELVLELCKEMYRESHNISSERLDSWARTYDISKDNPAIEAAIGFYTRFEL